MVDYTNNFNYVYLCPVENRRANGLSGVTALPYVYWMIESHVVAIAHNTMWLCPRMFVKVLEPTRTFYQLREYSTCYENVLPATRMIFMFRERSFYCLYLSLERFRPLKKEVRSRGTPYSTRLR